MHWLDWLAATTLPLRPERRFFHGGWGDRELLERYHHLVRHDPGITAISVQWEEQVTEGEWRCWEGSFESPVQDLPEESRTAHVRVFLPGSGARRLCLLMAAWNEHGYVRRSQLARRLAHHGIASMMLENPYFGRRRPEGESHPIETVVDFAIMGSATVLEARDLLMLAANDGMADLGLQAPLQLGVHGYSMGGNLAAFTSAVSPLPLATVTVAGSHSPAPVFMDGVIKGGIDWDALSDADEPEEALAEFLGNMSVLHFPPPEHSRFAIMIAGRDDGFVPGAAIEDLHRHWPGSELLWTREGHATLRYLRKPTIVNAIVSSFAKLEAAPAR